MESTKNYLNPRTLAELQSLSLRARRVVDGYLSGAHRSAHHGYSAEFSQHRPYSPGDDLRNVDWKAFGRTDRLFVKQFIDETNLTCTFLLDCSASMEFQGAASPLSKFDYAGCVVVTLSWLLRQQGDAVGLGLFANALTTTLSPQAHDEQIGHMINAIETVSFEPDTSFGAVMHQWSNQARGRSLVVIVSDLFDDLDVVTSSVLNLQHQGHELVVLQICDRDELDFPFERMTRFRDAESGAALTLDAQAIRKRYRDEFQRFTDSIRAQCQRHCIDFVQVVTDQDLGDVLSRFLVFRHRQMMLGV